MDFRNCQVFSPSGVVSFISIILVNYIPLTNRVRGPYCKLQTELFSCLFMAQACIEKKRGSVTYRTDRENEVNRIFIFSHEVNQTRGKEY